MPRRTTNRSLPSALETFRKNCIVRDVLANAVRSLAAGADQVSIAEAIALVRRIADHAHRPYPQYRAYWDGPEWQPVSFRQRVKTKAGIAFQRGDVTLAKRERSILEPGKVRVCAYSIRNAINTIVSPDCVEWLTYEPALKSDEAGSSAPARDAADCVKGDVR